MALHDVKTRLQTQLAAAIHSSLAGFTSQMVLVTRTNPTATAEQLLDRPDVKGALQSGLERAQHMAAALVRQAWQAGGGPPVSPVLQQLVADVDAAYSAAEAQMRAVTKAAFESVETRQFEPGVTPPGSQPMMESAAERAGVVAQAIRAQADKLVVSGRASLAVAAMHSQTATVLAEGRARLAAGEHVMKRWVSKLSPRTCYWCKQLHGQTIPIEDEFDHGTVHDFGRSGPIRHVRTPAGQARYHRGIGSPIIMTYPPKVWGKLLGPPRHPECECHLELVTVAPPGPGPEPEPPPEPETDHPFVSSADIAAMPDAQYHGMLAFITAAVHELGQLVRRILGL